MDTLDGVKIPPCDKEERRKVGMRYIPKVPELKLFTYKHVEYKDGWADAKLYLPCDFDLILMKLSDGSTKAGWSTGTNWDGLNMLPTDKVLYWKRKESDNV